MDCAAVSLLLGFSALESASLAMKSSCLHRFKFQNRSRIWSIMICLAKQITKKKVDKQLQLNPIQAATQQDLLIDYL